MPPERKVNPIVATIIIIVLVVGVTVGILVVQNMNKSDETATENTTTTTTTDTPATGSTDTSGNYTDGEYTETGSYSTPGGTESITVTVTLADGVITDVSADGSATAGNSATYQAQFLSGYKDLVVGESVENVDLSRVAGSSLTSDGFNRAIEAIRLDAAA